MKRKNIILVMLLGIASIFTMQSCTKDESPTPVVFKAAVPANPTPADGGRIKFESTSLTLKWEGVATTAWDVYFGSAGGTLTKVKSGVTGNTTTITVNEPGDYSWYVYTKDANNIVSESETWNITLWEDITIFTGLFDCDEPGYKHYDVYFTRIDANTIEADNWWDSGWKVQLVLNFTTNTLAIKTFVDGVYVVNGTGTIDQKTGNMVENYVVTKSGAVNDQNTHTYVKK